MYNYYHDIYWYDLNNIIYDNKQRDNDNDNFYGGDNFDDSADRGEPDDCCYD